MYNDLDRHRSSLYDNLKLATELKKCSSKGGESYFLLVTGCDQNSLVSKCYYTQAVAQEGVPVVQ